MVNRLYKNWYIDNCDLISPLSPQVSIEKIDHSSQNKIVFKHLDLLLDLKAVSVLHMLHTKWGIHMAAILHPNNTKFHLGKEPMVQKCPSFVTSIWQLWRLQFYIVHCWKHFSKPFYKCAVMVWNDYCDKWNAISIPLQRYQFLKYFLYPSTIFSRHSLNFFGTTLFCIHSI